jgi:hypothetical protein
MRESSCAPAAQSTERPMPGPEEEMQRMEIEWIPMRDPTSSARHLSFSLKLVPGVIRLPSLLMGGFELSKI